MASILLAGAARAKVAPSRLASARKGPVAITLRLYSTRVKRRHSLWYQIELKNVGSKTIEVDDKIFRDPWAMHENIRSRYGIYLQVMGTPGKYQDVRIPEKGSAPLRVGGGHVKYDYEPNEGETKSLPLDDQKKYEEFRADLLRKGLAERERIIAQENWWQEWNRQRRQKEDLDRGITPNPWDTRLATEYLDFEVSD